MIKSKTFIAAPASVTALQPANSSVQLHVQNTRQCITNILQAKDDRLLVVIGPCSIHDKASCMEYAQHLQHAANTYKQDLLVVMRTYFEKPRTIAGWKGLISDPLLNNTYAIEDGVRLAREILLEINALGLGCATEFLELFTPAYLEDLVSWVAIGARTTESQLHRQFSSKLDIPVGFKNNTSGNILVAVHACASASQGHTFLSPDEDGKIVILETSGNAGCHVILRGGDGTNYEKESVDQALLYMKKHGVTNKLIIDCSHANSNKQHKQQIVVSENIMQQIARGNDNIGGVMIESHLMEGNQAISDNMVYGKSVTDACLNLEDSMAVLDGLAQSVRAKRSL